MVEQSLEISLDLQREPNNNSKSTAQVRRHKRKLADQAYLFLSICKLAQNGQEPRLCTRR